MSAKRDPYSLAKSRISAGFPLPPPCRNRCLAQYSLLAVLASITLQPSRPADLTFRFVRIRGGSASYSDGFQWRVAVDD
jgi:hypothetical protein